jgi:hypothetical protein
MTTTTPIRTKRTGQHGSLWLSFEPKDDRTVLAGRYTRSPFGTVRANYPDGSGIPEVQITNPSGGILGGDSLKLEISLSPGSSATILTQAANKAYRGASSEQRAFFRVGEGAFFEYLPHHLIPYSGSDYRQVTAFDLAPDSTLITWDAYAAGRVARLESSPSTVSAAGRRSGEKTFRKWWTGSNSPGEPNGSGDTLTPRRCTSSARETCGRWPRPCTTSSQSYPAPSPRPARSPPASARYGPWRTTPISSTAY